MRLRMKIAAITGFLCVIAVLVASGEMPLGLMLQDSLSMIATALVLGGVCVLIAIYFDRNFESDGSARKKTDRGGSRR